MNQSINEIAKMIDHSLLHPTMTDVDLVLGIEQALVYQPASVCIKPYAVALTAKMLKGTAIKTCTVIGFPHGSQTTATKLFETREACENGATEIDMVVNIGKVLSGEWDYVTTEISQINTAALEYGAIVKVIFENDYLLDTHKIKLCEICSSIPVAFVKTSTGYGYTKGEDGKFSTKGATAEDVALMRKISAPNVAIKAAGGIRSLDDLLKLQAAGATRFGATATAIILEEAKKRLGLNSTMVVNKDVSGY
jgi:deoxyribose-phosphate aldolase